MSRVEFLKTTEMFAGIADDVLERVLEDMTELRAPTGTTVFRKGDVGDAIYLIVEGSVHLEADGVRLMTRGTGECIGEFALIDDAPRSATAVSDMDSILLSWHRPAFNRALYDSPEVSRGIFRVLTGKLRQDVSIQVDFALESERWRQDLQRAREIQMGMLPGGDMSTSAADVSGFCQAAVEVGGDYYDFLSLHDDCLGLIVVDVTGHGFYSGLFVAMAKSCLHTQVDIDFEPRCVMQAMRRTLSLSIQRRLLMSCCYVLLVPNSKQLLFSNAGHPFPYHYSQRTGKLDSLPSLDPILGVLETQEYEQRALVWEPGDVLVMYTDGITEARSVDGEEFGTERLESLITRHAAEPAKSIKAAILNAVYSHCEGTAQSDDLTVLVAKGN
jgi:sigma-B regulation protein RsbU (phosphoserine phosphatase)